MIALQCFLTSLISVITTHLQLLSFCHIIWNIMVSWQSSVELSEQFTQRLQSRVFHFESYLLYSRHSAQGKGHGSNATIQLYFLKRSDLYSQKRTTEVQNVEPETICQNQLWFRHDLSISKCHSRKISSDLLHITFASLSYTPFAFTKCVLSPSCEWAKRHQWQVDDGPWAPRAPQRRQIRKAVGKFWWNN